MTPIPLAASGDAGDLVARARAGDRMAEERLFALLDARIQALAKRKVWDEEAARDIAQDTLRTIHEKYRSAEFEFGFLPWVFSILHHKVGNYLKRLKTARGAGLGPSAGEEMMLDRVPGESTIELTDLVLALEKALGRISRECRMVIRLLLEGATRVEIHAALGGGVPGTLDSRVSRCRQKLLRLIEARS